jgi:hypothetical protein
MAKKGFLIRMLGMTLVFGLSSLLLAGCLSLSTTAFTKKYMDETLPVSEHSVLVTMPYVNICYMDDKYQKQNGVKADIRHYYLLMPGEHKLDYRYVDPRSHTQTGIVTTEYEFAAGHYYALSQITEGSRITMSIAEITDPEKIAVAKNAIDEKLNK